MSSGTIFYMPSTMPHLRVEKFGPIEEAEVQFGDLTVFVGPQATGKSLFLQLFKLLIDRGSICERFKSAGLVWTNKPEEFLELYLGEGMGSAYSSDCTQLFYNDQQVHMERFLRGTTKLKTKEERIFYIPAQRVICLSRGLPLRFVDFQAGDPFVLRQFSDTLHRMTQTEFVRTEQFFPLPGRMREGMRQRLLSSIFAGKLSLHLKRRQYQKRLVLTDEKGHELPFLVWSAGQREFVPMLLGFYWLMPSGKVSRRDRVQWVVIEEPEMGLHAQAILDVMTLVLELLRRKYRVCITSHSPLILDVVWALGVIQRHGGTDADVRRMLNLSPQEVDIAKCALQIRSCVYYFQRNGRAVDISDLDPGSARSEESGWGGLTEFSGKIGEIVAEVVSRYEQKRAS
jgi:hypothetical protein